jgi:hypothetical protein
MFRSTRTTWGSEGASSSRAPAIALESLSLVEPTLSRGTVNVDRFHMQAHNEDTMKAQITSVSLGVPPEVPAGLVPIAREVDRLHESVLWSAQGQFEQMKVWRTFNFIFGVPAAVLAAISGGTGLAATHFTQTPAILALVAAGFGAALTTLNPSRRVSQSQAAGNAYKELQTLARQLLLVRIVDLSREDALDELATITGRYDEVNKTSDPPSYYAYWRAKRSITTHGRQSYEVDGKVSK